MNILLAFAKAVDWLTDRCGTVALWAVLASVFISSANAVVRYGFDYSSNAYLEIQWYMFATCVMLGASQVLRVNEHVRVDVFYGRLSGKGQALLDLFGLAFFLLPVMAVMVYYSWPEFVKMFVSGEMSGNIGGLIRWPAMMLLPLGLSLLFVQGLSEIIKRAAWLQHRYEGDFHYQRPLQ